MERMKMLNKAVQLGKDQIDACASLSAPHYAELRELPKEEAVKQLAQELLQEAADTIIEESV